MGLKTYILKRFAYMLVLTFFVLTLNFIIFELIPGTNGVLESLIGSGKNFSQAQIDALKALYHIDDPVQVRYGAYMYNMLTLKFGLSFRTQNPVLQDMEGFLPNTLVLLGISTLLSIVIGIGLGILSAHKRGGAVDSTSVFASLTTFSLPTFWMGLLLLAVFSAHHHISGSRLRFDPRWSHHNRNSLQVAGTRTLDLPLHRLQRHSCSPGYLLHIRDGRDNSQLHRRPDIRNHRSADQVQLETGRSELECPPEEPG